MNADRPRVIQQLGQRLPDREDRDWLLATELAADADITYRQLDYWTRTGLLTPLEEIGGSGWSRRFAVDQVRRAQIIKALADSGMSFVLIRQSIDEFQERGTVRFGALTITIHHPSGDTAA